MLPLDSKDTAAETRASCGGSAEARSFRILRALVILRGGLTADSTGRTIPELKRGDQVSLQHPAAPDYNPGPLEARIIATFRYSVS